MSKSLIKQLCAVGTFVICAFSLVACAPSQKQQPGRKRGNPVNRSFAQVDIAQASEVLQAE